MTTTSAQLKSRRRERPPALRLSSPDFPYTMRMPDGRVVYVDVPGRWVTSDRDGKPAFMPKAVEFLDRIRALAIRLDRVPSPGFIASLREALGLTQAEFGDAVGVDKMTVSRWERGALRPSRASLAAIVKLRHRATRTGVTLPA